MIFLQEEEEILITKRYGVGGGGVFDNQNIYGGGQARAQGERLGYPGADQQGEGHGDGSGRAGQPQKIVQCNAMISLDRSRYSIQFRVVCISK